MSTTSFRNRSIVSLVLAIALVFGMARPSSAFLDKTRFVAHLGVAYFCFHHWVLAPYQAGKFAPGADHRISTMVKGGVALLFAVHEVQVAEKIAHTSNSPILHKLDGGVTALGASFAAVGTSLKAGHFNPADIQGLKSSTDSVSNDAAAQGSPIKDVPVAVPGA